MSDAQARAAAFVAARGDALARARAAAQVGAAPLAAALALLDPWIARGGPDASLHALRICDELGARSDVRVERACAELASAQREDGGFEVAGDLDARLVYTGSAAGLLAKTPFARPELLDTA